ncbi:MAG: diacylglycerol kinase family lipid kinase [Firmicutes bacterium]|nr:diacylglycerol kinase family lipid kinase [Bacillota bacterium]MCM1401634.1 diacylglycerol kinase family lipid kinase [Bacteroides sp.]MCM1477520.1 diacylglycerol kinase family lipid kinase [Bacteroides sp.]
MEPKRALLIINPISGTSRKEGLEEKVAQHLAPAGISVTACRTTCSGDATRLAREGVDKRFDMVLAAGGDGTVNETANALCGTGVPFGIIPSGSGNGLARHLNIPVDVRASLDIIAAGRVETCDHGSVNGRRFFCTFGMGFDAAVSHKFAESKKRGKLTYLSNTFKEYVSYRPEEYEITANGQVITDRAFVIAVCNASQYGNNAYIAPHASITDGLLDVTVIHYGNLLSTALVGLDLMTGFIERNMLIHTFRASSLNVRRKASGPVHIDGEPLEMGQELNVLCHPSSLKIFTPEADRPIRPLLTPIMSMMNDIGYTLRNIFEK